MTASSSKRTFFDLHITGIGYINRIRDVKPKKGDSFLACEIAALTGASNSVEYRRFDVKVSGSDAQHLIRRCDEAEKAGRKVLIGFRLGDLWVDMFTYSNGEKAGKPGVSLKARLLFISWIKIDGEQVYKAEAKDDPKDDSKAADSAAREEGPEPSPAPRDLSEPSSSEAQAPEAEAPEKAA